MVGHRAHRHPRGRIEELDDAELFSMVGHDRRAVEILVERHRGLAVHLANRYAQLGEPLDDVVQVATIGLFKAIERFDPGRGTAFSSFAVPTILGDIRRHFRDTARTVRVPRRMGDLARHSRKATEKLAAELGRNPTMAEIAAALNVDEHDLAEALDAVRNTRPDALDGVEGDPGGDDSDFDLVDDRDAVLGMLQALSERQQRVVVLRYYHDMTQAEIAAELGVSQMQVSRLLRQSLALMRSRALSAPAP